MNMSSSEAGNNEGYQKSYCEAQEVGLCVSQEVDDGKPTILGKVMSKKVDAIGPLEVGKGNTQRWVRFRLEKK